jgi:RNA polymerase sigma-70 factor (ECF subfamily)
MIARGLALLERAHTRGRGGPYQFQAAIAALHASAPRFEDTDWAAILSLYDVLLARQPSSVVALNRAVAVRYVSGPQAGLDTVESLMASASPRLVDSTAYHSARAEMLWALGRTSEATSAFDAALRVATNGAQRRLLRRRRSETSPPGQ